MLLKKVCGETECFETLCFEALGLMTNLFKVYANLCLQKVLNIIHRSSAAKEGSRSTHQESKLLWDVSLKINSPTITNKPLSSSNAKSDRLNQPITLRKLNYITISKNVSNLCAKNTL